MKIDAHLSYDRIRFDQDKDAHIILSLTAPSLENETKRPRVCIVPVIDVSPSMAGEKFYYAQRSILKLIDHLGADDYCGLVQFSSRADVVQAPVKMTAAAKDELRRKVGNLVIGNATNIADALLTGLRVANNMDLAAEVITRVILFTDGEANTGPAIKSPDILALMGKNVGIASVSAFGYGDDANQALLADIAKTAKGNYAYVQHPDAALTAFGRELGGLTSTYAMDLVVRVQPLSGHQITQVVSDVEAEENATGQLTIKIPDILAEETRHVVLAVKLAKQKSALPRAFNAFDLKAGYDIIGPGGDKERKQFESKVKVQFTKPGEEQDKPLPALDMIIGQAQIVRTQIEAESRAKRGDYAGADAVMKSFAHSLQQRDLTGLGNVASNMGDRMASAALYSSNAGYLNSMHRGATRGTGVACYDAGAEADLHSIGVSTTTASTARLAEQFQEIGDAPPYPVPPTTPVISHDAVWVINHTGGGIGTVNGIGTVPPHDWARVIPGARASGASLGGLQGPGTGSTSLPKTGPSSTDRPEDTGTAARRKIKQAKSKRW